MSNLKKLQMLITNSTNKTAQTGTCVMVSLLVIIMVEENYSDVYWTTGLSKGREFNHIHSPMAKH